jgi:hypothetical protein
MRSLDEGRWSNVLKQGLLPTEICTDIKRASRETWRYPVQHLLVSVRYKSYIRIEPGFVVWGSRSCSYEKLLWDTMTGSPVRVNWCFGGVYRLQLQSRRKQEIIMKQAASTALTQEATYPWFIDFQTMSDYKKKNSMVWVRERTIPTERPPLVGEVIANFCGSRVPRGQRDGSLWPYSRFSRHEPLLVYQVAPQLYSRGWVDLVPDPQLFFSW